MITSIFVPYLFLYLYYSKLLHESQYFYAKVNTFVRKFLYVAAQMQESAARGDLCYIKNRSAMVRSIRCVYIL